MLNDILAGVGDLALSAAIQFFAGILLSMMVYKLLRAFGSVLNAHRVLAGIIFAMLGVILPLGPFGILPIAVAALCSGLSIAAVVPVVASNMIFNMLVPFTDISFNPQLSYLRVLSALTAGILAHFLFALLFKKNDIGIRKIVLNKFQVLYEKTNFLGLFAAMINEIGLFLIIGVLLNAIRNYYFSDALGTILNSEGGLTLRNLLLDHNASSNPFFITSATIFNTVTDLTIPAAILSFLKFRSLLMLYAIDGCICALLALLILF